MTRFASSVDMALNLIPMNPRAIRFQTYLNSPDFNDFKVAIPRQDTRASSRLNSWESRHGK